MDAEITNVDGKWRLTIHEPAPTILTALEDGATFVYAGFKCRPSGPVTLEGFDFEVIEAYVDLVTDSLREKDEVIIATNR